MSSMSSLRLFYLKTLLAILLLYEAQLLYFFLLLYSYFATVLRSYDNRFVKE